MKVSHWINSPSFCSIAARFSGVGAAGMVVEAWVMGFKVCTVMQLFEKA